MKSAMPVYGAVALALFITSADAKSPQQLAAEAPHNVAAWKAGASKLGDGGLPRLADPTSGALLRDAFKLEDLRTITPIVAADAPRLLDACGAAQAVWKSYVLWSKDGSPPDTAKNEALFAPEISLGGAYTITCFGYTAVALRLFISSLPPDQLTDVRKQGLTQARMGMTQMATGLTQMLRQTTYSTEQKLMLARALEEAAPRFAALSAADGRAALVSSLASASKAITEPALKAVLESAIAKINALP